MVGVLEAVVLGSTELELTVVGGIEDIIKGAKVLSEDTLSGWMPGRVSVERTAGTDVVEVIFVC